MKKGQAMFAVVMKSKNLINFFGPNTRLFETRADAQSMIDDLKLNDLQGQGVSVAILDIGTVCSSTEDLQEKGALSDGFTA